MQSPKVLIYAEKIGPRLRYTADLVFRTLLGWPYQLTTAAEEARSYEGPLVVYHADPFQFEFGLRIRAVDLLFEKGLREQRLAPAYYGELPVLFRTHQRFDLPFDLFAAIFYLVSRYEEYLPHVADAHERYDPSGSLLAEEGWLEWPLVDHYALLLAFELQKRWPNLPAPARSYTFVPTVDVDQLYAYRDKGVIRSLHGLWKHLQQADWEGFRQHWQVLRGTSPDPFDSFEQLRQWHLPYGKRAIYFFLMGDYGGPDNAHSPYREVFRELVKGTADHFSVGLHPSYRSNGQNNLIDQERQLLEDMLNRPVLYTRQHFLKLRLPGTYQQLVKRDFEADFSMAYAAWPGFRSGTASPHYFYDLDQESPTPLQVYPTCVMDLSLQQYLRLSPEAAKARITTLVERVKAVEGTFVSLWHNSSLSEQGAWQGWRAVYMHLLNTAADGK